MKITMDGKYQTRKDGLPVEILRNNVRNADFPVVGVITFADGSQQQDRWMSDGSYCGEKGYALDLIPVRKEYNVWVAIGRTMEGHIYARSSTDIRDVWTLDRNDVLLARKMVTIEEGEFDDENHFS